MRDCDSVNRIGASDVEAGSIGISDVGLLTVIAVAASIGVSGDHVQAAVNTPNRRWRASMKTRVWDASDGARCARSDVARGFFMKIGNCKRSKHREALPDYHPANKPHWLSTGASLAEASSRSSSSWQPSVIRVRSPTNAKH